MMENKIKGEGQSASSGKGESAVRSWYSPVRLFKRLRQLTMILALLAIAYWLLLASDRYVSEANVIIRKTDSISLPAFDLSMLTSGVSPVSRTDQLLLRDYLMSVDMLKKLDSQLDLREHYSNSAKDLISRMWFKDASIEWFYRYYQSMVSIDYDDFAGILRIRVQAYEPEMAYAIASKLVADGEEYMNQLGHEMAEAQVGFLNSQVGQAQQRLETASQTLLNFQNRQGLLSPQATAESLNAIVATLETQRAQLQMQLASLPKTLSRDHPSIVMLKQSLAAVDRQIAAERAKLATPAGNTLNVSVEEFQRLQMQVQFAQDLYKSSLVALEKGRNDATRMLEKVSVLQSPTSPEYPMEPRRFYNALITLLIACMVVGILKLLESIVLDHVD
ncbi:chain-length determining protein [Bordetella pseudohinzii]|uniref:Chain-length determining protein n=2 Tax=Bordetella pseudohinzii TaxID=1331258 RepID=A0A0M7DK96_9BORD|nr:chain-length determining protein [Bordetella pseudohinzii]KXA79845.1 chain-length determining protein [Bordetella pseudohinzii]CUI53781.1 Tyrosine-protein kinase ptk [Bordetella pseudohinzii]